MSAGRTRRLVLSLLFVSLLIVTGCAQIPLASLEDSASSAQELEAALTQTAQALDPSSILPQPATRTPRPSNSPTVTTQPSDIPILTLPPTATSPGGESVVLSGPVPEGARARLGRGVINQIAVSPDGKNLAVAGATGLSLFRTDNLKEEWSVTTSVDMTHVAFSSDGKTLASVSLEIYYLGIGFLEFQLDAIYVWNTSDGSLLRTIPIGEKNNDGLTVAFSRAGNSLMIAESYDGTLLDQDWTNSGQSSRVEIGYLGSFELTDDGEFLAAGANDKIDVWDLHAGERVCTIPVTTESSNLALSPDGKTLALGGKGKIDLWSIESGKKTATLKADFRAVEYVVFSPDGKMLAAEDYGGQVYIWSLVYPSRSPRKATVEKRVKGLVFAPDGNQLYVARMDGIVILDSSSGETLRSLSQPYSRWEYAGFPWDEPTMAIAAPGVVLARGAKGKLQYVDLQTVSVLAEYDLPPETILSPDSRMYAHLISDKDIAISDTRSGAILQLLQKPDYLNLFTSYFIIVPDGNTVVTINDGFSETPFAEFWDIRKGNLLQTQEISLSGETGAPVYVFFSQKGGLMGLEQWGRDHGGSADIIRMEDGIMNFTLDSPSSPYLAISPNEKYIAANCPWGDSEFLCLYEANRGAFLLHYSYQRMEYEKPTSLVISSDNSLVICGTTHGNLIIWDLQSGRLVEVRKGHTKAVISLHAAPENLSIASTSPDGTVVLWDISKD